MRPLARILNRAVVIGALGCFVDSYDLVLFSTLRIPSLQAIGVTADRVTDVGIDLLNLQMLGMLVGGFAWGVLGDKRGRVSVLFGSIFLYSAATLANAFAGTVWVYGALRFLAGVGLAGEVGAAVTLVSENLAADDRGFGTAVIAILGAVGGLAAALVAGHLDWKTGYVLGGALGFALLGARLGMRESPIFARMTVPAGARGDLRRLLAPPRRLVKFVCCSLMGLPIWYVAGILISFAPELCAGLGVKQSVPVSDALLCTQLGAIAGDLTSGVLSQRVRSRKKALVGFLGGSCAVSLFYLAWPGGHSLGAVEAVYVLLGFTNGYWPVLYTAVAESFGTNLRSTVTISIPNLIRGSLIVLVSALQLLRPRLGMVNAALVVGSCSFALAFLGLAGLSETYGRDLSFLEH